MIPGSLNSIKPEMTSTTNVDILPRKQSQRLATFGPDVPSAATVPRGLGVIRLWMEGVFRWEVTISVGRKVERQKTDSLLGA